MIDSDVEIVLVHGTWMGAWAWDGLCEALERRGLASSAPSLAAFAGNLPPPGLSDHADQVAAFVKRLGRPRIVLVGHSYGAAVAVEASARLGALVSDLVVLDGFMVPRGHSISEACPEIMPIMAALADPGDPDRLLPPPADMLGLPDGPEALRLAAQLRAFPARINTDRCLFGVDRIGCRGHYLRFCRFPFFERAAEKARALGWAVSTLDAGHMAIATHPEEIARHLAAIAGKNTIARD